MSAAWPSFPCCGRTAVRRRKPHRLPQEQAEARLRAKRLEWATLIAMGTVVVLMGLVTGNSQAMRTAWIEDMLSFVPPVAVLIAMRVEQRAPDARFPFGYYRTVSIAFLCAALALTVFGGLLLFDAVQTLLSRDRPTIGTLRLFGETVWQGWVMIAVLIYSVIPPVLLGRLKEPVAKRLHNKALYADARMNRADWMTGAAAICGVLGIGVGLWWADAAAAALISLDVLRDGLRNLSMAVRDLADEAPRHIDPPEFDPLPRRMRELLERQAWVKEAAVMLREEGDLLTGQVYVVPRSDADLVARVEQAVRDLQALDWRLYDLAVTPVRRLD